MKVTKLMSFLFLVFLVSATSVIAAETAQTPALPGMDPAMAEKMAQMQALSSPTDAHKVLEAFTGKWNYKAKFWMAPGAEAEETTGTGENEMIYGGRFLKQHFEGPWMGQAFEGSGLIGYDNIKKEYVGTWFDNMSTGIMSVSGQYDATSQTLNQQGTHSCAMTGEGEKFYRSEWKVVDQNSNVYTSYTLDPNGQEYKGMEITYTRVPASS